MSKRKLHNRRGGFTQEIQIDGTSLVLRTGEYEDGTLAEVFLNMHKEGAFSHGVLGAFARLFSVALQYGVPLQVLVDKLKESNFEPKGFVQGSPHVSSATSVIDYLMRELEASYLQGRA